LGFGRTYEDLVAKYGEDNARYVAEVLGGWTANYDTLGYIDMAIQGFPDYEDKAKEEAVEKGWTFRRLRGDIGLLQRLLDGDWDPKEFLYVPPRQQIVPTYDDDVVGCGVISD
jgi:hypothetical protein